MIEVLWHGRGGQGAFTAARLLGAASSFADGSYALAFPSFGPERRGAPMRAFTKMSREPIGDRSAVNRANYVIYLDDTLLGEGWEVLEEGMNGRTTVFEDPTSPERCGIRYIEMLMYTHAPDLVVLMLGTNDMKEHLHTTNHAIARGVQMIASRILTLGQAGGKTPKVLVVSPIRIAEGVGARHPSFPPEAVRRSETLADEIRAEVAALPVRFIDGKTVAEPSEEDRLHLDARGHAQFAARLEKEIREMLG